MGSRDRLGRLTGVRPEPVMPAGAPPFEALCPLSHVIAMVEGRKPDAAGVRRSVGEIVDRLGSERQVLTEAGPAELLRATTPEIAQAIVNQRTGAVSRRAGPDQVQFGQGSLGF
jgi:PHP family Zn ribbon phosphoesterase